MSKPLAQMSEKDVRMWLAQINLAKYVAAFSENGVTGPILAQMDKASLNDIGVVKSFDQTKIMGSIDALKASGALCCCVLHDSSDL